MNSNIYQLGRVVLKNTNWEIESYKEYLEFVKDKKLDNLLNIIHYTEKVNFDKAFRWILEVDAVQYYVGVFPEEKTIRLASKNLRYELVLIEYYLKIEDPLILNLKEFIHKMATIPLANTPSVIEINSFKYGLPLFNHSSDYEIDKLEKKLSKTLIRDIKKYKKGFIEKLSDFGLGLTAHYMLVRVHLLKYLAILPSLDHDIEGTEVKRIFLETIRRFISDSDKAKFKKLTGQKRALPRNYIFIAKIIISLSEKIPPKFLAKLIRYSVSLMAKRFIAGKDIIDAQGSLQQLIKSGRDATLDQLGELVVSKKEAEEYTNKVLELIMGFKNYIPKGQRNNAGILKAHVSIKVSALCHDFNISDFEYTYQQIAPRLYKILVTAMHEEVFINIDAEHYHYRDLVFKVYSKVLKQSVDLKNYKDTGIVLQAYLKDAFIHFNDILSLAQERQLRMPIRLVKGAYWDAETIEADAHNFEAPQFLNKIETDIHFRQLIVKSLEHNDLLQLAVASHNIQDHCFSEVYREKNFPSAPKIEHQCLHMTYEGLSFALAKQGWATRNYIPIGNLLVGMAYLVRRIMENSSQVGVLTIMRSHNKNLPIKNYYDQLQEKIINGEYIYEKSITSSTKEFKNIYPLRVYKDHHLNNFKNIFSNLENKLQEKLLIDTGENKILCNSDPNLLLAKISYDSEQEVDTKIEQLFEGHKLATWRDSKLNRFTTLIKVSDQLIEKREYFASIIMFEAGKTIEEALADVDEAIDFINFYCREQISFEKSFDVDSFGVIGVIAPWNFPLAIAVGMTVAPLVAGNSVILKPAEQTPIIAQMFVDLCYECGLPDNILKISHGGAIVGKRIVDHKLISGIVFTGSKEVGVSIFNQLQGQFTDPSYSFAPRPKLVITEMGGKNAIIVCNNCELDETIEGIIYSSFAHAGQKCSAASRIIIDERIKESFLNRFIDAVKNLKVGRAMDFSTFINPLISQEDKQRVLEQVKMAANEAQKLGGKTLLDLSDDKNYPGYCVGPAVFELPAHEVLGKETFAMKELFAPVIHLIAFKGLDQAIEIFNQTQYALTGGIYGQSQDDIDYILPRIDAGNLYINRPNTGARVAIEPFGGYKLSGTGPKAGSADYIPSFNFPKKLKIKAAAETKINDQLSDNYLFENHLTCKRRIEMISKCTKRLMEQFEAYFNIVKEEEKKKLIRFYDEIMMDSFDLDTREFPNSYIPGQISFSNKQKPLGNGLLIDLNKNFDIELVIDVFINLIIGNSLLIKTQNENNHTIWKHLITLMGHYGISDLNIKLSPKVDKEIIASNKIDFLILTHKISKQTIFEISKKNQDSLLKIIYPKRYFNFDQRIDAYTHTKSFAINTMRHGAPLDLIL